MLAKINFKKIFKHFLIFLIFNIFIVFTLNTLSQKELYNEQFKLQWYKAYIEDNKTLLKEIFNKFWYNIY